MEAADAVAIAVAMVMPMRFGEPEHALDRAHGAADTGADRASDHAAHGTGYAITFVGALLRTTDNALGMAGVGHCKQRQRDGEHSEYERQRPAGGQDRALNLGFRHLYFLKSGGYRRSRRVSETPLWPNGCVVTPKIEVLPQAPSRKIQRADPTSGPIDETH
jgi:hypothetical protein